MGKGEIARYKQFLLFPLCFQKACCPGASKGVIVWEWVNPFPNKPWCLRVCGISLENTVGKGEIAHDEQFLLFLQCLLPFWRTFCHFHQIQNCHLQTLWVRKSLNFVVWEWINCIDVFHRNTCIVCKCPRVLHDIYNENFVNVRDRLGWHRDDDPTLQVTKEQTLKQGYMWVPSGLQPEQVNYDKLKYVFLLFLNLPNVMTQIIYYTIILFSTLSVYKLYIFATIFSSVTAMKEFVSDGIENIVGKEENTGFLLFPLCFQRLINAHLVETWISEVKSERKSFWKHYRKNQKYCWPGMLLKVRYIYLG